MNMAKKKTNPQLLSIAVLRSIIRNYVIAINSFDFQTPYPRAPVRCFEQVSTTGTKFRSHSSALQNFSLVISELQ